jgi:hypothetical protein
MAADENGDHFQEAAVAIGLFSEDEGVRVEERIL